MQTPVEQRLCFSGHRKFAGSYDENTPTGKWIKAKLAVLIGKAIAHGYRTFVCGGALYLDTLAAEEVIRQRDAGADIRLVIAVPCSGQDARWTQESRERYQEMLRAADCVHYVSRESYKPGCMDARDRWMISNVGTLIAFLEREDSGTGRAVQAALSMGKRVIVVSTTSRQCAATGDSTEA